MNKVTFPLRIWFQEDPQNKKTHIEQNKKVVNHEQSGTRHRVKMKSLPQGEYEFGFKLKWGCNQTYVFPKKVRIIVSALTQKPSVSIPPLLEGQKATLLCTAPSICSDITPKIYWKGIKDVLSMRGAPSRLILTFTPAADYHNANITCVAKFDSIRAETTVTLTVKFAPQILNSSQCMVDSRLLVFVCISWGNPLPLITWPLASLTDFSVTSSRSDQTVNSTVVMPTADYHNSSVRCISGNALGRADIEIPLHYYRGDLSVKYGLDSSPRSDAVHCWPITGVSLSVNVALLTALIVCTVKRGKSQEQRKELGEEMSPYASLNRADNDQNTYSNISPSQRQST
ncbi:uncharacterized protein LOC115586243 isoform X2 [Sparus aurata]|nr:uncharacterized protein LOC115586243 isoform X2 [Sparus aurata]